MNIAFKLSSGASAPYFGCYAPMPFLKTALLFLSFFAASSSIADQRMKYLELPEGAFTVPSEMLHKIRLDDATYPKKYWGEIIKDLKPLRVFDHKVNIAVVTYENEKVISGFYFNRKISSHLAFDSKTETYTWDKQKQLIRFTFRK